MSTSSISAIGKVIRGVSWDKADASGTPRPDYLPILRAGNISSSLNIQDDLVWVPASKVSAEQKMRAGDIAICMSSGSPAVVGKTASAESDWAGSVGAFCALIRANPAECLPQYLALFLKSPRFRQWASEAQGANIKNIKKSALEDFEIWLPPLDEQHRIVDILSRAEGIVRLRREAQKKAAELIPALFLEMFGDPATNPKGWNTELFGTLGTLDRGKSRHRPRDAEELYGGPYPFIQTGGVANSGGRITRHEATYSEAGLAQSKLWPSGTLCITIAANIAKTGVLEFDACFPDSVVGFLPGKNIRTEYVQAWLGFLQPTLEANAPQAAQKNINLEILRGLPVPVPPLKLQDDFEQRCTEVFSIQSQQADAMQKAEATFDALLAQVFAPRQINS